MRLSAVVEIEGRDKRYTVNELTVKEIIDIMSSDHYESVSSRPNSQDFASQVMGFTGYLRAVVEKAFPNLTPEEMMEMAPSELNILYEKFKEVNSHFFGIAQRVNLGNTLEKTAAELLSNFSKYAISLSSQAMEESGTTDTPS